MINNGDLFISDDNKKEIYIFKAGSDGIYGTSDDSVTTFDTLGFGSGDPEGVTFDSSGQGTLYIADGVNKKFTLSRQVLTGILMGWMML